jgi:hypothetical protein
MAAQRANKPARRVRLQPPFVLAPVPDPVLGSQHPPPPLAVEHGKVANRNPKSARLQVARTSFID